MKKLSFVLIAVASILLAGCQQDLPKENPDATQDVVFNIGLTDKGLKSDDDCAFNADYALIFLGDEDGQPLLDEDDFPIDPIILPLTIFGDNIFTATLKMPIGTYTLLDFILMDQVGDDPDLSADIPVSASPAELSDFAALVDNPIGDLIVISAFEKVEIPIDVLCYYPADFEKFGFTWFKINLTTIKEGVFFGDLCSFNYEYYRVSDYGPYAKFDMPAIFKLKLYLFNETTGLWEQLGDDHTNALSYDGSSNAAASIDPITIQYSDADELDERYKIEILVYQMVNDVYGDPTDQFEYLYEDTWYFTNDMTIIYATEDYATAESFDKGQDGVFDFIAGECEVVDFDIDLDDPGDPEIPVECAPCEGGVISITVEFDGVEEAEIYVTDGDNNVWFGPQMVKPGDLITLATETGEKFPKNDLEVFVDGELNTELHTSCSKPVNPGLTYGLFTITEAISLDNGLVCPFDVDDGPLENAETAFAYYTGGTAECFLDIPELNANRWGWTNTVSAEPDVIIMDIYAGAGGCDFNAGTHVGTLKVEMKDDHGDIEVTSVTYELKDDYKLYEVHLYIGQEKLPMVNGTYTVSPGQYTYVIDGIKKEDHIRIEPKMVVEGNFYLIAHAVVK